MSLRAAILPIAGGRAAAIPAIFALATFGGAFLLFLLEPMFVKLALPRLGGSSEVWTASVLFYQTVLLAGYAYAHLLLRLPGLRRQALVHGIVCVLALSVLPIAIPAAWHPPSSGAAIPWLLGTLVATVGLPFFALSATSPLLQAWFARARPADNPYALYAASNIGSLIALIAYPFAIEPRWGLHAQSIAWSWAYLAFVAALAGCAVVARDAGVESGGTERALPIAFGRKLRWVAWAFIPSSLMLSVTTYLSERVAPIPLLWALPLGIYLLSFAIVFGTRAQRVVAFAGRYTPVALMPLLFLLTLRGALPAALEIPLHAIAFAAIAIVCHGAIAADRPAAANLTGFYLCTALGGVIGGAFNSVIAPLIFPDIFEYSIVIALACFALPAQNAGRGVRFDRRDVVLPALLAAVLGAALILALRLPSDAGPLVTKLAIAVAAVMCFSFSGRPVRFGLGVSAMLAIAAVHGLVVGDLHSERNFYGVKRVEGGGDFHALVHGHTFHGAQNMTPAHQRDPQTYYTRGGPLGDIFRAVGSPHATVAVVGLGAGTTACYRPPGAAWTFYEIDPGVVAIARDVRLFRYVADCAPASPIVVGDARLTLGQTRPGTYDLIVLDAYASDAIPTHLLTREAMQLYRSRLSAHGAIAFHISNSYFDFAPLISALAADTGMISRLRSDGSQGRPGEFFLGSRWMIAARTSGDLGSIARDSRWSAPAPAARVWTDDYSSIVTLFHRPV